MTWARAPKTKAHEKLVKYAQKAWWVDDALRAKGFDPEAVVRKLHEDVEASGVDPTPPYLDELEALLLGHWMEVLTHRQYAGMSGTPLPIPYQVLWGMEDRLGMDAEEAWLFESVMKELDVHEMRSSVK